MCHRRVDAWPDVVPTQRLRPPPPPPPRSMACVCDIMRSVHPSALIIGRHHTRWMARPTHARAARMLPIYDIITHIIYVRACAIYLSGGGAWAGGRACRAYAQLQARRPLCPFWRPF
jgi:hypothetical protein